MAGWNRSCIGALQQKRSGAPHLLLQQPRRGVLAFALKRIGTNQFGKVSSLMGRSGAHRTHFVQNHSMSASGALPSSLAASEASSDDGDFFPHSLI
jgi:hypothetical protein